MNPAGELCAYLLKANLKPPHHNKLDFKNLSLTLKSPPRSCRSSFTGEASRNGLGPLAGKGGAASSALFQQGSSLCLPCVPICSRGGGENGICCAPGWGGRAVPQQHGGILPVPFHSWQIPFLLDPGRKGHQLQQLLAVSVLAQRCFPCAYQGKRLGALLKTAWVGRARSSLQAASQSSVLPRSVLLSLRPKGKISDSGVTCKWP